MHWYKPIEIYKALVQKSFKALVPKSFFATWRKNSSVTRIAQRRAIGNGFNTWGARAWRFEGGFFFFVLITLKPRVD